MIAVEQSAFSDIEERLTMFLRQRLQGLRMETMSVIDDRVSLHYQYRTQRGFDWTAFTADLNHLAEPGKIEVFIG